MYFWVLLNGFLNGIDIYINKHLVSKGITKRDYSFYMCFSMVPFAALMLLFEPFKFEWSYIPCLLLVAAGIIRILQQRSVVGTLKFLNPYESSSYTCLALVLAFLIDGLLGVRAFSLQSSASIFLTLAGIFILADVKLSKRVLQKEIIIRILTEVAMGYIAFYILKYWSNAFYILILNGILTLLLVKNHLNLKEHVAKREIIKWVFIEQTVGFTTVYIGNYLAESSVTLYAYVRPITILFTILLIPLSRKTTWQIKPKIKDILAVLCVALGVLLLKLS